MSNQNYKICKEAKFIFARLLMPGILFKTVKAAWKSWIKLIFERRCELCVCICNFCANMVMYNFLAFLQNLLYN